MTPSRRFTLAAFVLFMLFSPHIALGGPPGSDPATWILGTNPRPNLQVEYGIDVFHHKRLEAEFPSVGALELKLGYSSAEELKNDIVSYGSGFLNGAWYRSNLGGGSGGTEGLSGTLGRFGFGYSQGYGYNLKDAVIIPYFGASAAWTQLKTARPATLGTTDTEILNRYEGTFRFGPSAESGIHATFGKNLSVAAGYEVNIVYPRVVFWEWFGSYLIVGAANGVVAFFSPEILDSSPTFGPVVIFALRTAVAWGFYQLYREEMNWPFSSETPLTHETLKFGVGFAL